MFVGLRPTVLVDEERGTVFVGLRPTVLIDEERGQCLLAYALPFL